MSRQCCPRSQRQRAAVTRALGLLAALSFGPAAHGCSESTEQPPAPISGAGGPAGDAGQAGAGRGGAGESGGAGAGGRAGMVAPPPAGMDAPAPDAGPPPDFDAGTDPGRNDVQPGGICQRLATLQCAGEAHCCDAPGRTYEACLNAQATTCSNELQLDLIAADPIAGFDAAKTSAALTMFELMASQCDPDIAAWGASTDGLRSMLQGTRAPGESCLPPVGEFPTVASYGAALASCSALAMHACLFTGHGPILPPDTASCAARGTDGSVCFVDTNCSDELFCDNPGNTYSGGTCAVRRPTGAACTLGPQCDSRFCKDGSCLERSQQAAYCLVL